MYRRKVFQSFDIVQVEPPLVETQPDYPAVTALVARLRRAVKESVNPRVKEHPDLGPLRLYPALQAPVTSPTNATASCSGSASLSSNSQAVILRNNKPLPTLYTVPFYDLDQSPRTSLQV